jgi:hypothetical protein
MNKTYRIVQYIQPWEIDSFERQVNQMILSSYFINSQSKIIWDVTLNTDIVNWDNSKIAYEFFLDKFKYLETIVNYYYCAEFDTDVHIQGAADKKRSCADKLQDYTIWLDSDIYFSQYTLASLISATDMIEDDMFVLTPEIIKYWDSSWDCITNQSFINEPYNLRDTFDLYSLDSIAHGTNIVVDKMNALKFGAGWFTCISDKLIKTIKIPIGLGSYGPDDTYIMLCGKHINVPQYVVRGIVVSEIGAKYETNKNYIKPLLEIKISDKQKISDMEFHKLIQEFYAKH